MPDLLGMFGGGAGGGGLPGFTDTGSAVSGYSTLNGGGFNMGSLNLGKQGPDYTTLALIGVLGIVLYKVL